MFLEAYVWIYFYKMAQTLTKEVFPEDETIRRKIKILCILFFTFKYFVFLTESTLDWLLFLNNMFLQYQCSEGFKIFKLSTRYLSMLQPVLMVFAYDFIIVYFTIDQDDIIDGTQKTKS